MASQRLMRLFARWHIWLGWLVGVPLLMWTVTGLVMVAKPIEEVRGEHLRTPIADQPLPRDTNIAVSLPSDSTKPVRSVATQMENGEAVTRISYMDGTSDRFRADGSKMSPLSEIEARMIVQERVLGGADVVSSTRFAATKVPFDFRRDIPVWQVVLADGTHVYVGTETGQIEAVRTRWWRLFDVMWGLHIMDLETRHDTHHPILIFFTSLSLLGVLLGCVLMFRRRRARVTASRT